MTLGAWLTELRERAGLSRLEAAAAVGADRRSLDRWETDQVEPKARALLRLFRAYGVKTDPPVPRGVL